MLTSHLRSSSTLRVIRSRKNPERSVTKRSSWRGFRRRREEIILILQSWRRRRILVNPSQAVYLGGRLEGRRKVPWRWLELRSPGTKSPLLLSPAALPQSHKKLFAKLSYDQNGFCILLANTNTGNQQKKKSWWTLLKYARLGKFLSCTAMHQPALFMGNLEPVPLARTLLFFL